MPASRRSPASSIWRAAGAAWEAADAPLATWREQLFRHEKSLFLLLRAFGARLADDAHVLSLSTLGGSFGRDAASPRGLSLQGGGVGLLKSLREERPTLRVKAVDVDPAAPLSRLAAELMQELELVGGRQEVGYPGGVRTVFRTVAGAVAAGRRAPRDTLDALVVLATGGARGITAETLRELARPGNVLILTGRSPLVDEPEALAACADAEQVRQHFIAQVRSGAAKLTPADIERKTAAVLAGREMRANLDDFRRRGATVEYHVVDVARRVRPGASDRRRRESPRGDQRRRARRRRDRGQAARRQDQRELVARRRDQGARRCCCCSAT